MSDIDTTITARELGRAYAACLPEDICEDAAWIIAALEHGLPESDRFAFLAGYREASL